jgi:hypothetical protein
VIAALLCEGLVLVQLGPGEHEAELSAAEAAVDRLERIDADLGLARRVTGVEVGGP